MTYNAAQCHPSLYTVNGEDGLDNRAVPTGPLCLTTRTKIKLIIERSS